MRKIAALATLAVAGVATFAVRSTSAQNGGGKAHSIQMSAMGQHAQSLVDTINNRRAVHSSGRTHRTGANTDPDTGGCFNQPDCDDGTDQSPSGGGGQAETALSVDATGQNVVVGYNDTRGFSTSPVRVSGFSYSSDGGQTFTDGGQLPSTTTAVVGSTALPEVFGDPDIKYLGGCNFVYSSILVTSFGAGKSVQTMGIHRSTDCGHTWQGPFEVTAATNPNGQVDGSGNPRDAADKEFMDVDPDTGRVVMSWTNFTPYAPGGTEIASTYSDNVLTGNPPTWSPRAIVSARPIDGTGSMPRLAGAGSPNAYAVWANYPGGYGNGISFSRSLDNGQTWQPALDIAAPFLTQDYILGNDRSHTFPALAVDNSGGPYKGNIYVVYTNNKRGDGADVVFQRSTDSGVTFSNSISLTSRPGKDRAQWFPAISVDKTTGRIWVHFNDQGIATSGDLMETVATYSDNGGVSWSKPFPLSQKPFHGGWGNDTGQPNLGDYNASAAQGGHYYSIWAVTQQPKFSDIFTLGNFGMPFIQVTSMAQGPAKASLRIGNVSFTESGGTGFITPSDSITLTVPLNNYVTNPLSASTVPGISATLTTSTPGVNVIVGSSAYPNAGIGGTVNNTTGFQIQTTAGFVPFTPINLVLTVTTGQGSVVLPFSLDTGTPTATTLLTQNWDSQPSGTPISAFGWTAAHGAGSNTVPWTTTSGFCGTGSNGAFHINANDQAPNRSPSRWERLISPTFNVPAGSQYVTVDFDICYNTEDDPILATTGYDGLFLRVTDVTPGHTATSVLAEAFAQIIKTGTFFHYPKHMPRSSDSGYFPGGDMSMWSGDSQGLKHVSMKLPGMAGTSAQLRFEFAQDSGGICTDVRPSATACGVVVDNIVVQSIQ